jgi:formate dehydrogenase iron-sulfur subunit
MVYHDTRRAFWSWPRATINFLGTTLLLGSAMFLPSPAGTTILLLTAATKFIYEASESARFWSASRSDRDRFPTRPQLTRSRALLNGPLALILNLRLFTLLLGSILSILAPSLTIITVSTLLLSELLERHLFFTAVSPDRMPGAPS